MALESIIAAMNTGKTTAQRSKDAGVLKTYSPSVKRKPKKRKQFKNK